MKYILKIFKLCFWITFILLLLINVVLLFSKFVSKKDYFNLFGYTYFEVLSGSMSDEINIGDIVLVKLNSKYNVGDVVTYKSYSHFITHRIVKIDNDKIITKGDANNTNDDPINQNQIIGKVVKRLKRAGIYIKVFMNFKVIVLIFMMIMVSVYIFSEIEVGNDYSEKKVN